MHPASIFAQTLRLASCPLAWRPRTQRKPPAAARTRSMTRKKHAWKKRDSENVAVVIATQKGAVRALDGRKQERPQFAAVLLRRWGKKGFRILFWTNVLFTCDDGVERISCSWKEWGVFLLMSLGLAVVTRGKELHRVSHAHAALFVTAGEKARSSRVVGLPDSARRRLCRRSRSQSQRHRGSLNSERSRLRATMSFERAHAMFPHALIVVCAACSASAPPQQVLLLGRLLAAPSETTAVVYWLRRARRRARRGVARARDSISSLIMGEPQTRCAALAGNLLFV